MTRQAGSPKIDATRPALTDLSRLAPGLEKESCDIASIPSHEPCLRCSGLLVRSYTAALESDLTGRPIEVWRCINCGDCLDSDILANRWKAPEPLHPRTRPRTGAQHTGRPHGALTGRTQDMLLERDNQEWRVGR
jgi:hypothetical protein